MVTVYRIEGPDGLGLFRSKTDEGEYLIGKHPNWTAINNRHCNMDNFPNPYSDRELDKEFITLKIFAYNTKEMVNKAITREEMKIAKDIGFRVFEIKINNKECSQSPFQTVLYRSKIVEKKDITDQFI